MTARQLCPAQRRAYEGLLRGLHIGDVVLLGGGNGTGRTTVLRAAQAAVGGRFLAIREFVDAMRGEHPLSIEETFGRILFAALAEHDTVVVDDLDLVTDIVSQGYCSSYPRAGMVDAMLESVIAYARSAGKKLIFASAGSAPAPVSRRAYWFGVGEYTAEDYAFLCAAYLSRRQARALEYGRIFRFAPHLTAEQLKAACVWLRATTSARGPALDTDRFIEYLRSQHLTSNVDLDEVQRMELRDLKGIDAVIDSLEANIALPLENDALAVELDLKPKRGVLLAGPPGTGKTTVGRALAHRLKSKFFLIDGTIISGTDRFYGEVSRVFQAAKENAPSVIFIDDSDVIFESGEESGLYRYLLTMLDGLESENVGQVCVMLTAMDVGNLPPALMRSGRVELWLEMSLPDAAAREAILRNHMEKLPASIGALDLSPLVAATDGFTGADLKRLMEDGKLLLAYDRLHGLPLRTATEYFLAAVKTVLENKARYQEAAARTARQHPSRPPWFTGFDAPEETPV